MWLADEPVCNIRGFSKINGPDVSVSTPVYWAMGTCSVLCTLHTEPCHFLCAWQCDRRNAIGNFKSAFHQRSFLPKCGAFRARYPVHFYIISGPLRDTSLRRCPMIKNSRRTQINFLYKSTPGGIAGYFQTISTSSGSSTECNLLKSMIY